MRIIGPTPPNTTRTRAFLGERLVCATPPRPPGAPSALRVQLALNGVDFLELPGAATLRFEYYDPPAISFFVPAIGLASADTRITLAGAGLAALPLGTAACVFGGARAALATVTSDAVAVCASPAWDAACDLPPPSLRGPLSLELALNGADGVLAFHPPPSSLLNATNATNATSVLNATNSTAATQ